MIVSVYFDSEAIIQCAYLYRFIATKLSVHVPSLFQYFLE